MKHEELTRRIIEAFFNVHNELGYGFLEKVYENALCVAFEESGLEFEQQVPVKVEYRGRLVGEYVVDLVVEGRVIIEVKAVQAVVRKHEAQLVNYLKATGIEVGLILNFGPSAKVVRKVLTRR
ncbi:MAG: GxxExxY protein [Thermoanaerobaculales bacterium]|jgi:GxxExxY protein|nr:GxxExxY protein [Thermoanaerobaculales bacterium]